MKAKDRLNRNKHGVSLAEAEYFNWQDFLWKLDRRGDYAEDREAGIGTIGSHLYKVVYVERGDVLRIISLRKATQTEEDEYASQYEAQAPVDSIYPFHG
jgi:uncharacterized DUF497 family protein